MRLAVFDLDGTLIAGNSFHLWILHLLRWSVLHGQWGVFIRLCWLSILRITRRIDHIELKKSTLRLSLVVPTEQCQLFTKKLFAQVRPELLMRMQGHKQDGMLVVIATAALELYLVGFAELCGADQLLATSSVLTDEWQENLKAQKLLSLQQVYGADAIICVAYSDHSDDLPLLAAAQEAIIVAPSSEQWLLLTKELTRYERL